MGERFHAPTGLGGDGATEVAYLDLGQGARPEAPLGFSQEVRQARTGLALLGIDQGKLGLGRLDENDGQQKGAK
jgi:hypothetical protein